jgi:hypothetical protein
MNEATTGISSRNDIIARRLSPGRPHPASPSGLTGQVDAKHAEQDRDASRRPDSPLGDTTGGRRQPSHQSIHARATAPFSDQSGHGYPASPP